MDVGKRIGRHMIECAGKDWPKSMTKIYLRSPMKAIWVNARSAFCRCRLIQKNVRSIHAAAKWFVSAAFMPIALVTGVHSVENPRKEKPVRE
jgi:hypothetical protein